MVLIGEWFKFCTKQSRKRQDFKKGFPVGWFLIASTMLHEKCCNTVLQLGAPVFFASKSGSI